MTDNELLEKRLDILKQVDKILPLCLCNNANTKHSCEHCEKLSVLGEQLLGLTKPRKVIKADGSVEKGIVKDRICRYKPKEFTMQEYINAKVNGITDTQFATSVSMSTSSFYRWKTSNLKEINRMKKKMKAK